MAKVIKKTEKMIDATGRTLGRVASLAAVSLMGKDSPSFKREAFSGAPVMVKNAGKIRITTKKLEELSHNRYSGYPGGLKTHSGAHTAKTKGMRELVRLAVYRMLPGNKLRKEMMKNLTIEE